MKETALYIHIPFCDHKCIYCDFYSIITSDNIDSFLKHLKNEIYYYSSIYSQNRKIISIFFGGGTPSLMKPGYLKDIISAVKSGFVVDPDAEITMESNPGTLDKNKLGEFRETGINRISIGVQSFDDKDLQFLTRIHNSEAAMATVHNAEKAGFDNISIDLIFNLPGQSKHKWLHNLETAVDLPIKHISPYSLILERGTILNKMVLAGKVNMQGDDNDADLYDITMEFFESRDFLQYEVSNFARPGFECIHNKAYWQYKDYFGFGPSAHSFINGKRSWNYSSLKMYISKMEDSHNAVRSFEVPDEVQRLNEYVMLSLRSSGINISNVETNFDKNWFKRNWEILNVLKHHQFIELDDNYIRLTRRGYAVCDEILEKLN